MAFLVAGFLVADVDGDFLAGARLVLLSLEGNDSLRGKTAGAFANAIINEICLFFALLYALVTCRKAPAMCADFIDCGNVYKLFVI